MADKALTTGQKLVRLGDHFGLNQSQWAEVLNIARSTLTAYKTQSKPANPKREELKAIGERFGVPLSWFLSPVDDEPDVPRDHEEAERRASEARVIALHPELMTAEDERIISGRSRLCPVWQGVVAGLNDECQFPEWKTATPQDVPDFFFAGKDFKKFVICLPVGLSMSPRIVQGDKVVVRLEANPPPNSIIIARRADGINYIKVFRTVGGLPELHSVNDNFPPIQLNEDWVCRGVVTGVWKPYLAEGPNIEFNGGAPLRA